MKRLRRVAGFVVGVFLMVSGAGHGLLAWPGLEKELVQGQAVPNLRQALEIGWRFGGAAMFAFGAIVLGSFSGAERDRSSSFKPALAIGLLYVLFGGWALAISGLKPFFLVFLVPGIVLVLPA